MELNLKQKEQIIKSLVNYVSSELELASSALASSRDLMSQDDMKPEGKYDTRRTEVGYLVAAQSKRVEELKIDLEVLENFKAGPTSKIEIGSLVKIENLQSENDKKVYFICPTLIGHQLEIDNQKIAVISYKSPMAQECITLSKDDYFEMQSPKGDCEFKILEVI